MATHLAYRVTFPTTAATPFNLSRAYATNVSTAKHLNTYLTT